MHAEFLAILWSYYETHGRAYLPWRQTRDPYAIMVSELMLQQTQVARVIPKFEAFLVQFPDVQTLASAPLADVLRAWQGLGYNRRAKYLWLSAQAIQSNFSGRVPATRAQLITLPGIGPNTAGAILAYAFNEALPYLETNIRSVLIYHFFSDKKQVSDAALLDILNGLLPADNPREFYWALMDYGTHLKETTGNHSRQSSVYRKQSRFEGSDRQLRGKILRLLGIAPMRDVALLEELASDRTLLILEGMRAEKLIDQHNDTYTLPGDSRV